ncbi:hypothetical protein ACTQ1D_01965 [Parafannyhessea umbonata]|uniref:hypothetical protein n=1 Tax=Parafannyhessea umbonata TaxID=604330 RepID=UPI003F9D50C1
MPAVVALAPVFDRETGRTHMPGHVLDLGTARAEALVASGAARWAEPGQDDAPPVDLGTQDGGDRSLSALYDGMTRAQLVDVASVEGVVVPPRATKAEIVSLLEAAR